MKKIDGKDIYTVAEVNYFAKQMLEQMIFWVEGEISSCRKNPSWSFYYLDLKDEKAVLPCIAEEYMLDALGENPAGQKILAFGNLSLYEPFGKYQFRIAKIEKFGEGLLLKQLEELIKKLKSEGLFDVKYKKEIPKYPRRVCVVTSKGSDAANDFKRHTVDKFPIIELYIADVRVQGPQSIPSLLEVLPQVDQENFDVIVITRGGGSIEDLAAFNDEQVARTIFAMQTPTVVAIGHEANESLAEWVADVRASTPTDAANIICAGYNTVLETLNHFAYRLKTNANYYFSTNFQKLDHLHFRLQISKKDFTQAQAKTDELMEQIKKELMLLLQNKKQQLESLNKSLTLLSPQNTLLRGYSITTNESNQVIRSTKEIVLGQIIGVKLAKGSLKSKVTSKI